MSDRDQMIANEQQRLADFEARRKELQAEYDKISPPVLKIRQAEERMRAISNELQNLTTHSSAVHADFNRKLENALPAALPAMVHAARAELGGRHHDASAEAIDRLASLRRWLDEADAARRDPEVTTADLEALVERGRELNLSGRVRAFDDPQAVRA